MPIRSIAFFIVFLIGCDGTTTDSDAELKRGKYLVDVIAKCAGCHSPRGTKDVTGELYLAGGMVGGKIRAPNITPDEVTGIGGWSDTEIEVLIRHGRRPDGTEVHPVMPSQFYRHMTNSDMHAMIRFLRTVPPRNNLIEPNKEFPVPASEYATPPAPLKKTSENDVVALGSYLATLAHCMRCHTPTRNGKRDYTSQLGAGGLEIETSSYIAVSSNVTPHLTDGIGRYSIEQIAEILRTGERPDGTPLLPMMGTRELHRATPADRHAIAVYLKSLDPKPNPSGN